MAGFTCRGDRAPLASRTLVQRKSSMSSSEPTDGRGPWRTWVCVVCGFIYDEAAGYPQDGIAPGTRWEDVPDWWTCPDCGVTKADFDMVEV